MLSENDWLGLFIKTKLQIWPRNEDEIRTEQLVFKLGWGLLNCAFF